MLTGMQKDEEVEEDMEEDVEEVARPRARSKKSGTKSAAAEAAPAEEDNTTTVKLNITGGAAVDQYFPQAASYHVYSDASGPWDFTGNQTNVANNNNKFYILQLLEKNGGGNFKTWTRWGRVGYVCCCV